MYHLEIINNDEILLYSADFTEKQDMLIHYNTIKNNWNTCSQYKGDMMQLFEGVDFENLHELESYRIIL